MIDRVELELLAIELYKFDKGTMRQYAGIDKDERIQYRMMAAQLLAEPTEKAPEPAPVDPTTLVVERKKLGPKGPRIVHKE